jgi:diguanylate cyclase (GGDEF)-like protein
MAVGEEMWRDPDVLAALERASLQALMPRPPAPVVVRPPPVVAAEQPPAQAPPSRQQPAAPPLVLDGDLQQAIVGLVLLDGEHVVTWVNAAACVLVDRLPGELLGAALSFLSVGNDLPYQSYGSAEVWTPMDDPNAWRECRCRRPDGAEFEMLVQSVAIPIASRRPDSWLLQLIDPARTRESDGRVALTDPLTGLPSQALLVDRLQHALARSERNGAAVAVVRLRFELDPSDNERPVHMSQVLLAASRRLRSALRDTDTVARTGDDGFTLVCEEIADSEVQTVADRVVAGVGARFNIDGRLTPVTIRSGVAVGRGPVSTSSSMIAEAEAAMS